MAARQEWLSSLSSRDSTQARACTHTCPQHFRTRSNVTFPIDYSLIPQVNLLLPPWASAACGIYPLTEVTLFHTQSTNNFVTKKVVLACHSLSQKHSVAHPLPCEGFSHFTTSLPLVWFPILILYTCIGSGKLPAFPQACPVLAMGKWGVAPSCASLQHYPGAVH